MSADTTEQDPAGGEEMRARYLPVSRKELRRRREEELAQQRAAQEDAESTTDELAEGAEAAAEGSAGSDTDTELARAIQDTEAVEAVELPAPPRRSPVPDEDAEGTEGSPEAAAEDEHGEFDSQPTDESETEAETAESTLSDEPPQAELPEPVEAEEPARPEEELADAVDLDEPDVALSADDVAALTAEQDEELLDEAEQAEETTGPQPQELVDDQDAPVPASRRGRRLLRETEDLPQLAPELMAELQQTTSEIARNDDPNRVDPELLKKQQALAAKAMQANQERMRRQKTGPDADPRRRQRPESEVITGRALRDAHEVDYEEAEFLTGRIQPVHAEGAHGLELSEMLDETSRQASRQGALPWIAAVLAVLLLVALVLIFVL